MSNHLKKVVAPVPKPVAEEKRGRGLTRFEWMMSGLTLLGIVVAAFTGFIFWEQLVEMRTSERPWVSMLSNRVQFPKEESVSVNPGYSDSHLKEHWKNRSEESPHKAHHGISGQRNAA
jgi:hypothetical protein